MPEKPTYEALGESVKERTGQSAKADKELQLETLEPVQAWKVLQKSQNLIDGIINNANTPIIVWDSNLRIIRYSRAFEDLSGYTAEEVIGNKGFEMFIPPADCEDILGKLPLAASGEKWKFVEIPILCKNGDIRTVLWNSANIYAKDGATLISTIAQGIDITEHKQAEAELIKSEQKYRHIFENTGTAMAIFEEDTKISLINSKFENLSGYSADEIEGKKNFTEFVVQKDLAKMKEYHFQRRINPDKTSKNYEFGFIDRHGNLKYINLTIDLVPGTNQSIASFSDITPLKQSEEKAKLALSELEQIGNTAPAGICLIDKNFNVLKINKAALGLCGLSMNEAKGRKCHEIFLHDMCNTPECVLTKTLDNEECMAREIEMKCINGKTTPCILSATPFYGHDNEIVGIVEHVTDITLRKKYENELKDSLRELRKSLRGTIKAMALTVEIRDPYTAGHQRRVADLASSIAEEMGLPRNKVRGISMAGALHDIGKIAVPAEILSKPGLLSKPEFELIKNHPQTGYDILKLIKFPWPVAQIVLQHHERMDGSGYPDGLSGEKIIMSARILGVADVVEAMASHRPYRPALGIDKALEEISINRGKLYDADVVDACLKVFRDGNFRFKI